MKKVSFICLIIAVLGLVLCACGEKTPKTSGEGKTSESTEIPVGELTPQYEEDLPIIGDEDDADDDENEKEDEEDSCLEVDKLIRDLTGSEEYQAKTDEEKVAACQNLLDELLAQGEIKNLLYDQNDMMFSFEYKNGYLGGVMIKDFDPNLN